MVIGSSLIALKWYLCEWYQKRLFVDIVGKLNKLDRTSGVVPASSVRIFSTTSATNNTIPACLSTNFFWLRNSTKPRPVCQHYTTT